MRILLHYTEAISMNLDIRLAPSKTDLGHRKAVINAFSKMLRSRAALLSFVPRFHRGRRAPFGAAVVHDSAVPAPSCEPGNQQLPE